MGIMNNGTEHRVYGEGNKYRNLEKKKNDNSKSNSTISLPPIININKLPIDPIAAVAPTRSRMQERGAPPFRDAFASCCQPWFRTMEL